MTNPITLYIELLKSCLTNSIYQNDFTTRQNRDLGIDCPTIAHTMIGTRRLNNLQFCVETALKDKIPGDLIETGVWRGGATILMRGILKAYNITDRNVWVADSFQGLPTPNLKKYPHEDPKLKLHLRKELSVSLEQVKENFRRYNLLDDQVKFLKGWFKDTLPLAPISHLAVLRLDGDLYESTIQALDALYPKLSPGGFVIIDDYVIPSCQKAVLDYRKKNKITEEIIPIDSPIIGSYWRKKNNNSI